MTDSVEEDRAREEAHHDFPWRLAVAAALIFVSICYFPQTSPAPENAALTLPDDAYYYFKTAYNTWQYGYPTFDGVTHTNGVQPLWFLVCAVVAAPFAWTGAYPAYLVVMAAVNALLYVAAGVLLFRLLRRRGFVPHAAAVLAVSSLGLGAYPHLLNGMETALLACCILLLAQYTLDVVADVKPFRPFVFGGLSALVFLARLDTAILLPVFYLLMLWKAPVRRVFLAGAFLIACAIPFFAWNLATQGEIMPISGTVKSFWGALKQIPYDGRLPVSFGERLFSNLTPHRFVQIAGGIFEPWVEVLRQMSVGALPVAAAREARIIEACAEASTLVLVSAAIAAYRMRRVGLRSSWNAGRYAGVAIITAVLAWSAFQVVYYVFYSNMIWPWYVGPGLAATLLVLGLAARAALNSTRARWNAMACAFLIMFVIGSAGYGAWRMRQPARGLSSLGVFAALGQWLHENTPPDAVAGSWAAGLISSESGRRVVNLEGLIADRTVLDANRTFALTGWLASHDVQFIANHFPFFSDGVSWDPRAPMPDDVFWHIRTRPLFECPEAFTEVDTVAGRSTTGCVLAVDAGKLRGCWSEYLRLSGNIARVATAVEAETYEGVALRGAVYLPFSSGWAVTGKELTCITPGGGAREVVCYARAYAVGKKTAFSWECGGTSGRAGLGAAGRWAFVPLGRTNGDPIVLRDLAVAETLNKPPAEGVFIDTLLFVASEREKEAGAAFSDYLAFVNRHPDGPIRIGRSPR